MSPGDIARLSYDPFELTQLPESVSGSAPAFGEGRDLFASPDGTFRVLFVQNPAAADNYRESRRWLDSIRTEVALALQKSGLSDVTVGYTGGPAFVAEISSSMERDLRGSVGVTTAIVVLLFWWAHRQLKPLLWLLAMLGLTLVATLGLGGIVLGTINVVSIGFAAILVGLAEDYGIVLCHESIHHRGAPLAAVRRAVSPGIIWSAVTTTGAFLVLNLGGLPGLGQLGTLVAIGIAMAALIMLSFFLQPFLLKGKGVVPRPHPDESDRNGARESKDKQTLPAEDPGSAEGGGVLPQVAARPGISRLPWATTIVIALFCAGVLVVKRPGVDRTTDALRPKNSPAYIAMDQVTRELSRDSNPDWILVWGNDATVVRRRLAEIEPALARAVSNGQILDYTLPLQLLPSVENQAANRAIAAELVKHRAAVHEAALAAGFTTNALGFTDGVFDTWRRAAAEPPPLWPTNLVSRWALDKVIARDADDIYALGLVRGTPNHGGPATDWRQDLPRDGVWVAGWQRLGSDLLGVVEKDMTRVLGLMSVLIVGSLWLAFKRFTEVLLSLAALLFSGLCLWTAMALMNWSWNLLNLLALPLLLGVGLDYGIHIQLGLRRHGGIVRETRQTIGRALLLCAATTMAGFGSNVLSSNAGLASLGLVCAAGVAAAALTSIFLLPAWWRTLHRGPIETGMPPGNATPSRAAWTPSSLYRRELWQAGQWIVRIVPRRPCLWIARTGAMMYWVLGGNRRNVVIENLLPVVGNDPAVAARTGRRLFGHFAVKLVDLWLYESGRPIDRLLGEGEGWDQFTQAQARGRGVLLLTPHLGNWEMGGPWMHRRGVSLQVLTQAEPGRDFTRMRQAARARWDIETLVIGNDPFAFLEVIRRLESGATVALLIDRPPSATAIEVELFGRPFAASVAAAELARASGCTLLPVILPKTPEGYGAKILEPVPYERETLRDREARRRLTQQILRVFEPAIRQYADQWYHFVPVWPKPQ
jgi:predicted RND superfamily exporter protein/lauroyl/myristoyl acyltransferase